MIVYCEMFPGVIQLNRIRYAARQCADDSYSMRKATYHIRSTSLGEKINVEGFERGTGNHATPRTQTKCTNKDSRPLSFTQEALTISFHHPDRKALCVAQ
jgi:hypothetical protein